MCLHMIYCVSQIPQKKTQSTTLMQAMSQDTSTCRQIPVQKKTSRCTKLSGPQTQPTDKSRSNRIQIVATPNPQEDPEEVIRRRRMQWRIKKQEQRARKAVHERRLCQMLVPPQGQDLQVIIFAVPLRNLESVRFFIFIFDSKDMYYV